MSFESWFYKSAFLAFAVFLVSNYFPYPILYLFCFICCVISLFSFTFYAIERLTN